MTPPPIIGGTIDGEPAEQHLGSAPARDGFAAHIHDLKVWPEFFVPLRDGLKTFEARKNDRDYRVGDTLRLHEWAPGPGSYTGRMVERRVTYIGRPPLFGALADGYVVMALCEKREALEP